MQYRIIDHEAKPFSQKYLQSIYVLKNGNQEYMYGCVPNGGIGISVVLNGTSQMQTETGWEMQPPISIYGLVKKIQFHKMSPDYHEINFGFSPQYLQPFLKYNLSSLKERSATDLNLLFQKDDVAKLFEALQYSSTDEEIRCSIELFLQRHLRYDTIDKRILAAQDFICQKNIWKVEALSTLLNISPTALRCLFKEQVGISPKDLIKIHRIKKALDTHNQSEESLTELAYKLEYYDQAHFIHDFKGAIGLTPKQYFSNQQLTFDFYNFQRWRYDSFAPSKIL